MSTFLGAWLAVAVHSMKGARELAKPLPPDHPAHRQAQYWEHVCGAISWLADKVTVRQQHLLIADLVERGELPAGGD